MKKMIIMLGAVACAAIAQAAAINWSVANNSFAKSPLDDVNTSRTANYTVMLFAESNRSAVMDILATGTTSGLSNLALVDATKTKATGKASGGFSTEAASVTAFTVIFDTYTSAMTLSDAKNYIVSASITQASYSGSDPATELSYGTAQFAGASWQSLQSVPEPTSGLLLLLGMAGLALRRKQA